MSRLTVSGQFDMPTIKPETHLVIALSDREYRDSLNKQVPSLPHLHLAMHDMPFDDTGFQTSEVLQYPETKHLEQLRDYLAKHQPARVHVACHAGVSRSTALTLAVYRLMFSEKTDQDAVDHLFKVRPHCYPNRRIVRQADALFGWNLEGALHAHFAEREPQLADDWTGPN